MIQWSLFFFVNKENPSGRFIETIPQWIDTPHCSKLSIKKIPVESFGYDITRNYLFYSFKIIITFNAFLLSKVWRSLLKCRSFLWCHCLVWTNNMKLNNVHIKFLDVPWMALNCFPKENWWFWHCLFKASIEPSI